MLNFIKNPLAFWLIFFPECFYYIPLCTVFYFSFNLKKVKYIFAYKNFFLNFFLNKKRFIHPYFTFKRNASEFQFKLQIKKKFYFYNILGIEGTEVPTHTFIEHNIYRNI